MSSTDISARARTRRISPWRFFPKQDPAFAAADADDPTGEFLRIFSVEVYDSGSRCFVVSGYPVFFHLYDMLPPSDRHHYEIIRDGWPCHLYLDLEYMKEHNPGKDGQAAVDIVLRKLREALAGRGIAMEDSGVIELDSSTQTKFSRHLIVRLRDVAFENNIHAGEVVKKMVNAAAVAAREGCPDFAAFFVRKGNGEEALFVDTAVYTRNRAFRLYMSSKIGKTATLESTGRYGSAGLSPKQLFMASLVCNVPPGAQLLRCFDDGAAGPTTPARLSTPRGPFRGSSSSGLYNFQRGPSPHSDIDEYIEIMSAGPDEPPASIRNWTFLGDRDALLYNIKGSRWCDNVGRHHKSNGEFYVVNLHTRLWFQKCHDPDCKGFRSPMSELPLGMAEGVRGDGRRNGGEWSTPEEEEECDVAAFVASQADGDF